RQISFDYDAETEVFANPTSHLQLAGLAAYYNRFAYHTLLLTYDEAAGTCLQVVSCNGVYPGGHTSLGTAQPVPVPAGQPVRMKIEVR
ncbi:hypothetical protein J8J27_29440, partial [Mycobacterium tuberculosis]|nr:hypothetical protein [Mycobacterium tuberculosis]